MDKINLKEYTKGQAKDLVKHILNLNIKQVKGEGTFEVVASTQGEDRAGEVILVKGWDTENYLKNPIILYAHDYSSLPVGAATEVVKNEDQLIVKGVFANTPEGQKVRQLYDDGILRTVSVGFIPMERDGNVITKAELLELSFVPVPCNPEALSLAKGFSKEISKAIKAVVPFGETPMAPEEQTWSAESALSNLEEWASEDSVIDWAKYQQGFAWFNSDTPEEKGSYELPHHDIMEDELVAVWQGVLWAMGTLLGVGESPSIPEEEKQAVYNHLAQHYKQFGKEAPEFKEYTEEELRATFPELYNDEQDVEEEPEDLSEEEEEVREAVSDVIKRLDEDVKGLLASAKLQIEQVTGFKKGAKSTGISQKAGRTLSAKTRTAIQNAAESATKAAKDLNALLSLTDSEPEPKNEGKAELLKLSQSMDKLAERMIKNLKSV